MSAFCLVIPPWLCGRTGAVQSGAVQCGEDRGKRKRRRRRMERWRKIRGGILEMKHRSKMEREGK